MFCTTTFAKKVGPKETRVFRYVTNWVQFEAEAVPFPEHLFQPRSNETAKQRKRRAQMKRLMKERFIWERKRDNSDKYMEEGPPKK